MGIKRVVDVGFWNDEKVMDMFSPEDKLFMLYLLTNPHSTQLGIYAINPKYMSLELGYTIDTINVLLDRFENTYEIIKYSRKTKEIAVKNFLRHSIVKGGAPVRDCLARELREVKDKTLIEFVFSHIKQYDNINETVKDIIKEYEKHNGEIAYCFYKRKRIKNKNDNENENENENEVSLHDTSNDTSNDTYAIIIDYLNEKAGTKYKATTTTTKKHIKARLTDGFTIDDFKAVIDKKCSDWLGTEYAQYLRPSTLFGTKFESYLNAPKRIKRSINDNGEFSDINMGITI